MNTYLQWIILSALTGSPMGSAVFLLLFYVVADRYTLGLLPDPLRWVRRWQRAGVLERAIRANAHDGPARLELAGLYIERRQATKAVDVLKPNLERGDGDVQTLFVMGAACLGAGFHAQGEKLLAHAQELDPDFRVGEIDLVLGRDRLARKEFAAARSSLEALVKARRGTVEGRVLLARALDGLGDDGAGALMRDQAWHEYESAPRFQRKQERLWAWRAKPSRPALYGVLLVVALAACATVVRPAVARWTNHPSDVDDE
jgi:FAD/FMN-containing dehydrogenase